jgi:hypothetical protein
MLRKLARAVFTVVAASSGILCLVLIVLWVRSYRVGSGAVWKPGHEPVYYSTSLGGGRWRFDRGEYKFTHEPYLDTGFDTRPPYPIDTPRDTLAGRLGFEWHDGPDSQGAPHRRVILPMWFAVGMTAVLPAWAVWRWRGARRLRHRMRHGLCPACGYDLRATRDRCPECGAGVGGAPHARGRINQS